MEGKEWHHGARQRAAEAETVPTPGTRQPRHPTRLRPLRREPKGARGRRRRLKQDGGQMGGRHPKESREQSRKRGIRRQRALAGPDPRRVSGHVGGSYREREASTVAGDSRATGRGGRHPK